ncbi:MAG: DUF3795 domain-containing protein [Dehalococcoidia bacterium]
MDEALMAMCGAYCGSCEWKEKTRCPGCLAAGSRMFWGVCDVANCAISRGFGHCGLCPEVPCATLQGFFDDPEHGDNGERLANLRAWARGERIYRELTRKTNG